MNANAIKCKISRFFNINKTLLIFIIAFITLGVFTGVFCAVKLGQDAGLSLIQNVVLKKFFLKQIGLFAFLFLNIFVWLAITVLCFFLASFKVGRIILVFFLFYLNYVFGIDVAIILCCLGGVRGVVIAILGVFLPEIIILFALHLLCIKFLVIEKNCICRTFSLKNPNFEAFVLVLILILGMAIIQTILLFVMLKIFVFL